MHHSISNKIAVQVIKGLASPCLVLLTTMQSAVLG